jgi:hypothetical protein
MEQVPRTQVEWIDEIVFPEGFAGALNLHFSALKLHLSGAPKGAKRCNPVQQADPLDLLGNTAQRHVVQSGASEYVVPPARFELALPA